MSTYTCSRCNKPLPAKVMRCPHCGVLLSGEVAVEFCMGCKRTVPASEMIGGRCARCRNEEEVHRKTADEETADYLSCAVMALLILGGFGGAFFFWRARLEHLPWQIVATAFTGIALGVIVVWLFYWKILPIFLGGVLILASLGCALLLVLGIFGKLGFVENLLPWLPKAIIHAAWWMLTIGFFAAGGVGQGLINSTKGKGALRRMI
jgi:hypothetical protein